MPAVSQALNVGPQLTYLCETALFLSCASESPRGPSFPCSLVPYLFSHKSAVTKARNTIAITPFMVKNAAFNRRRSRGETRACS